MASTISSLPSTGSVGSADQVPIVQGGQTKRVSVNTLVAAAGGSGANLADAGYDLLVLMGQSNMQGDSGGQVTNNIDITNPKVYVYAPTGGDANRIVLAADPLQHLYANGSIVGPGMELARWYQGTTGQQRRVLIVPCAYNGTAMLSRTPRWDPTTAWTNDSSNLYNLTIAQVQSALSAAGANSRIAGFFWIQGESDAIDGNSATTYRTDLEYLIDGVRSRLNVPTVPFVIGSMTPEFMANYTAPTKVDIDAVHKAVPSRKAYTAFAQGVAGLGRGDNLHYAPAGAREMGRRLAAAIPVAQANTAPTNLQPVTPPAPPGGVALTNQTLPSISGTFTVGSTLTANSGTWAPTPDSYTYQWKRAGSNITGATASTYTAVSADSGQTLTVTVTAIKAGYGSQSATSAGVTIGAAGGGGGGSTTAADNFNRADGAPGTTPTGNLTWQTPAGTTWAISGNQVQSSSVSDSAAAGDLYVDNGTANGTLQSVIRGLGGYGGLVFRAAGDKNATGYVFWLNGSNYVLSKRTSLGAYTQLGITSGISPAVGDTLTVVMNGSSLTCKINGSTVISITDSSYTGTRHGLWNYSTPVPFDDFALSA